MTFSSSPTGTLWPHPVPESVARGRKSWCDSSLSPKKKWGEISLQSWVKLAVARGSLPVTMKFFPSIKVTTLCEHFSFLFLREASWRGYRMREKMALIVLPASAAGAKWCLFFLLFSSSISRSLRTKPFARSLGELRCNLLGHLVLLALLLPSHLHLAHLLPPNVWETGCACFELSEMLHLTFLHTQVVWLMMHPAWTGDNVTMDQLPSCLALVFISLGTSFLSFLSCNSPFSFVKASFSSFAFILYAFHPPHLASSSPSPSLALPPPPFVTLHFGALLLSWSC